MGQDTFCLRPFSEGIDRRPAGQANPTLELIGQGQRLRNGEDHVGPESSKKRPQKR